MGKDESESRIFHAARDFTCWRDREYNDQYPCQVFRQGENTVNLNLDIVSIVFAGAVAEEIARCLYDAVLITVGNLAGFAPTPAARNSLLKRKYRKGFFGWTYNADGDFNCHGSDSDVYFVELVTDANDTTKNVGVYTVDEGGVELVFEFMCYSFSMLDAVWLANSLMEAIGGEPLDVLETTSESYVSQVPLAVLRHMGLSEI
ncbi:hypothetical protein [Pseudomonas sp. PD9R]|uniref:hypothetical protein n=1 Tax=Pseudomonas sp. PD9R TaxID=2853534 RepID=UPI001C465CF6|nr:hypothetical protein [Pseudomonas sp. PD9R]MBV6823591.1 hypothetical protein [Pseudomonas sp. PD9R]